MKDKRLFLCASLLMAAFSLWGFDLGGSLASYTRLGTPADYQSDEFRDFSLKQEEILSGWFRKDFSRTSFLACEVEARHRYTSSNLEEASDGENAIILDLKSLSFLKKFDGKVPVILNAGRFNYTDLSGLVFSQAADGALVSADFGGLYLRALANYTGLLNAQNTTILNSEDSEYSFDSKKIYAFAPGYANFGALLEFPYIFANQTVSAEVLASLGLESMEEGSAGYDRLYATLALNGFLSRLVCYNLSTTIGAEFSEGDGIANLTKVSIIYLPGIKDISLSLNAAYASGEQLGFSAFRGFSSMTAVNSYSEPEYTGLLKGGISASIKASESLLAIANASAVFACPDSQVEFSGVEAGLSVSAQIFSDLSLNAAVSQFFARNAEEKKGTFTLGASLAF